MKKQNILKILMAMTFIQLCPPAFANDYYRFWRGRKLATLTYSQFIEGLNGIFIPETVKQGKDKGLTAYLPVLLYRGQASTLPDEMALVAYESELKYRQIRSTPEGIAYGKLHGEYFDMHSSKSLVPQKYVGIVEQDHAYDLLEGNSSWRENKAYFICKKFKDGFNSKIATILKSYVDQSIRNHLRRGITSHLILVDHQALYEYVLFSETKNQDFDGLLVDPDIQTVISIELSNNTNSIDYGKGINHSFQERD